jgi:hypothetical protein
LRFEKVSCNGESLNSLNQIHHHRSVGGVRQRRFVVEDTGDEMSGLFKVAISDSAVSCARQFLVGHDFKDFAHQPNCCQLNFSEPANENGFAQPAYRLDDLALKVLAKPALKVHAPNSY